ncbi:hypothetical protein RRG08_024347 [Elysia crispata]|uniref:Uncharacterized protein n=1 Tax=Elysia crispata TaxID=231223 RepID=A0AAE1DJ36_9GAST|nr:hypothetical protein RRG08_024347 [Elysia crispata]
MKGKEFLEDGVKGTCEVSVHLETARVQGAQCDRTPGASAIRHPNERGRAGRRGAPFRIWALFDLDFLLSRGLFIVLSDSGYLHLIKASSKRNM